MPVREKLPETIRRSPKRAQDTWIKAHDSAVQTYGEGRRANQTAFAALRHSFEKVGDHWEPKSRRGPSDRAAAMPRTQRRPRSRGGVDANASLAHLKELARRLEIPGRSRMNKNELVDAIQKANARETRRSRARARRRG